MKRGKSWENVLGQKVRAKSCELGKDLAEPVCSSSSWYPFICGDKDASFLQVKGGHLSQEGLKTCFREEGKMGG